MLHFSAVNGLAKEIHSDFVRAQIVKANVAAGSDGQTIAGVRATREKFC